MLRINWETSKLVILISNVSIEQAGLQNQLPSTFGYDSKISIYLNLARKEGVFYPWPKRVTDGRLENIKRLKIMLKIDNFNSFMNLSDY
jgi:hypothetical protein